MGPFVPEFISDQMNLVVALFIGIGFGFVLEQAGFSSSRRLAGVFYGYDFTVLRVFFTAAVTAMLGVMALGYLGMLDTTAIFVNPMWLKPALVGGVIMGLGFILGGYCPGTSVCAVAIGKVDALFFVGGGLLGVLIFGELYPLYHGFYESTALGPIKVFESLHVSQGMFALGMTTMAVVAFIITTRIERKVNPKEAPSLAFPSFQHGLVGAGLLVFAGVLAFLPDHRTHVIRRVSAPDYVASHPVSVMTPDELAFRLMDPDSKTLVIDLRSPSEFEQLSLPGSIRASLQDLFRRDLTPVLARRHVKKVLMGGSETEERTACLLLLELGYENIAMAQGGFAIFKASILDDSAFVPNGNRWDEDLRQFRAEARTEIHKLIANARNAQKTPKVEKKIQGGC